MKGVGSLEDTLPHTCPSPGILSRPQPQRAPVLSSREASQPRCWASRQPQGRGCVVPTPAGGLGGSGTPWRPFFWDRNGPRRAALRPLTKEGGCFPGAGRAALSARGAGPVPQEGITGPRAFRKCWDAQLQGPGSWEGDVRLQAGFGGAGRARFSRLWATARCPSSSCWLHVPTSCSQRPGDGERGRAAQEAGTSIVGHPNDQGRLTLPEGHPVSSWAG